MIPYVNELSERIARVMKKRRITTAMHLHTTVRNLLVHPKDKMEPREGVYKIASASGVRVATWARPK